MNKLIETLKQEDATVNDFLSCLEEIKTLGDILLLTVYGKKNTMWTEIVIILPSLNKQRIRYESSDVKDTLIKALREYVSVRGLNQQTPSKPFRCVSQQPIAKYCQAGNEQIEDTLTNKTMNKLIETLQQEDATFNDLLSCLEKIISLGDVCLLKMDGERDTGWTTIVIYFHPSANQEPIRYDSSDFRDALIRALQKYVSVKRLDQ